MGFSGGTTATLIQRSSFVKDFWSDVDDEIDLPAVAADTALPSIVVAGLPSGITLTRVVLLLKARAIENTNGGGPNAVNGAQVIEVKGSGEAWAAGITAINMADDMWTVAASTREAGDVVIGDNDIKATVSEDGTYNVQWADARVDLASLRMSDVQVGVRMFWEVE